MADDQTTDVAGQQTTVTEQTADTAQETAGKTFTQAEVDALIEKRFSRMKKQAADEVRAELAEEARQAQMTEAERLKAEKDQMAATLETERATIRTERVLTRAEALASKVGNPDFVADIVQLAGIDGTFIDDNGKPDEARIQASIDAALEKRPFYKKGGAGAAGSEFGGGAGTPSIDQQIADAQKAGDAKRLVQLQNQKLLRGR